LGGVQVIALHKNALHKNLYAKTMVIGPVLAMAA
jgi:hypothetical protein